MNRPQVAERSCEGMGTPALAPQAVRLAFCITVYNEGPAELQATLAGLQTALAHAQNAERRREGDAVVAVIVDGWRCAHPALLPWLQAQELVPRTLPPEDGRDRQFPARLPPADGSPERLHSLVYLKAANCGKLDSHARFFSELCAAWAPRLCFQLDCGTVVSPGAVLSMIRQFDEQPDTAALAAVVTTPEPAATDGPIAAWQYIDFALQARVHMPAEVGSGHLSVLPGQFCGLRWAALQGSVPTPLARYLRGMQPSGTMERTMFLAEDRVLGSEVVLHRPGWQLRYCADAQAVTDACGNLRELQRQRRRWINGSTACRLWFAFTLLRRPAACGGWLRATGMLWQMLLVLVQLAAPAVVLSTLLVMAQAVQHAWHAGDRVPLAVLALALACTAVCSMRPALASGMRDTASWISLALLAALVARMLSPVIATLLVVPHLASAWAAGAPPGARRRLLRRFPEYLLLINPLMQVYLTGYALLHVADTSWGTKGLANARRSRTVLGALAMVLWLLGNGVVLAWAQRTPGLLVPGLNPLLEFAVCYLAASLLLAAVAARGANGELLTAHATAAVERTAR